jgi:hypothetical protein
MKFISLAFAVALSFCAVAAPGFANSHEDKRLGYKIYTPKKWSSIPVSSEDGWIVAKYLSPKPNFYTDKESGYTYELKPEVAVVVFLSEKYEDDAIEKIDASDGKAKQATIRFKSPYKTYPEYLKGTYRGAGFFIAEEEEVTIGDYLVTKYVIKVEKLSYAPKRIITWVYHTADIDFAIQVECFESAYPKLKKEIKKIHGSFKEIPRTEGTVSRQGVTGGSITFTTETLTPEERTRDRKDKEKAAAKAAKAALTDGWEYLEIGPFIILNHANDKQAKIWADRGQAVLDWCEDEFPYLGKNEYVSKIMLRICKDYDEAIAFSPFLWISSRPMEINLYKDDVGKGSYQHQRFNTYMMDHWLRQKDGNLYFDLPTWMRYGLKGMISNSKTKGKKLEMRPSDWENMELREEVKAGTAHTPQEIFLSGSESYSDENFGYEATALMRFLLSGPGSKSRLTKGIVESYFKNLQEVMDVIAEEDDDDDKFKDATTEEEEEAQFKARQTRAKENERRVIDETFERTFGTWTDKEWSQFEKAYFKAIR